MRTLHSVRLGRLGWLGAGTMIWAAGCLGGANTSALSSGGGGSDDGEVYAPWSSAGGGSQASEAFAPSTGGADGEGTSAGATTGAGGSGGATAPNTSLCDPGFSIASSPLYLSYPAAKALVSPALVRGLIGAMKTPDPSMIQPAEFLNYYRIAYDAPGSAAATPGLTVSAALGLGLAPTEIVLQIAVQAPAPVSPRQHGIALTVVVDSSLSMAGESMKRAKAAVLALAEGLQAGDTLAVLSSKSGATAPVPLKADQAGDPAVLGLADLVAVDGGDDLGGALALAYDVAAMDTTRRSRVVLITDGGAPATSINLGLVAGNLQKRNVTLSGVGVGGAVGYRSQLLDLATRVGGGASVYLDSPAEAENVLHARFEELMDIVASDVSVTVTLPWYLTPVAPPVISPSTASSVGAVPSELGPGRTLVFRQVLQACNGTILTGATDPLDVSVTWKPVGPVGIVAPAPVHAGGAIAMLLGADALQVAKGSVIAAYAEGLQDVARPARLQLAHDLASSKDLAGDADIAEILGLIEADPAYTPATP